jgi:hypothetical protein
VCLSNPADVAGQRQSFFGEQRFFALAAARPQSRQMNFAFLTSGLSCFSCRHDQARQGSTVRGDDSRDVEVPLDLLE